VGSRWVLACPADSGVRRQSAIAPWLPEPGPPPETAHKARLEQTGPEFFVARKLAKDGDDRFSALAKPSCLAVVASCLLVPHTREVENPADRFCLCRRKLCRQTEKKSRSLDLSPLGRTARRLNFSQRLIQPKPASLRILAGLETRTLRSRRLPPQARLPNRRAGPTVAKTAGHRERIPADTP
jgi:hypothetical protein